MNTLQHCLIDTITHKPVETGGVLALGNFDGVHLGHKEVISVARKEARKRGIEAHVLTFEPHPYSLFKSDKKPFLLTTPAEKHRQLLLAGADRVVTLSFTPTFAEKTPEAFIHDVLIEGCRVKHVVTGFDFVFGHGRGGDRDSLRLGLSPYGIDVTEVPPFRDNSGEIISSTRIRSALRHGRIDQVIALLGRPFSLEGQIQRGDQRGRTLGFPTANMDLGDLVRPAFGVYVVRARLGNNAYWGVANIGLRPTVGGNKELLEFHLFDLQEDLYDQTWTVELHHFLRSEKSFADLSLLQAQIQSDIEAAKKFLNI